MYSQISSKLAVPTSPDAFSQAVSMAGGNAVEVEATTFAGTTLDIFVQESNDLQNWEDISGSADLSFSGAEYKRARLESIAAQYVRLRYDATGATAIVAAGINVANL